MKFEVQWPEPKDRVLDDERFVFIGLQIFRIDDFLFVNEIFKKEGKQLKEGEEWFDSCKKNERRVKSVILRRLKSISGRFESERPLTIEDITVEYKHK